MSMYLWALLAAIPVVGILYATGLLQKLFRLIYGDFEPAERNKFLLYGTLFFFIIGIYWSLRCVKDAIFSSFIGADYIWQAKILSMFVVFPIVILYSYLVDLFPRHRLFYALSVIYSTLFVGLSWFLTNESYGVYAPQGARWRLLGWVSYIVIESFGSLLPALFYSFMADTTTPESGKKGFFITATFAQVGAIIGSGVVAVRSACWGVPFCVRLAGFAVLAIIPVVAFINWAIPKAALAGYQAKGEEKTKAGFWEGVRLLVTQPYLLGIFVVVFSFEAVVTIMDLQFKIFIGQATKAGGASAFAGIAGGFGTMVSTVALISLLLGIGNIGRKIGIRLSLALIPVLIAGGVVLMYFASGSPQALWYAFWVCVFAKAINYALGQPSKEQLYIPTSKDAKYKSKALLEMFGGRSSKASGAAVMGLKQWMDKASALAGSVGHGLFFITAASLGVCAFWFAVALYLGKRNRQAVERNEVVC
ncbi:MAG: hypothetical protein JW725_02395 [Candidatus Babeliaceae bacterium]|nr:hypothetical protein [Candidatus Babeliaceae bacterium]